MPANMDFNYGVSGKFFHPNATLNIPLYLDKAVQRHLAAMAARKVIPTSDLTSDLLKRDIQITKAIK
jgi:hypothetical protein